MPPYAILQKNGTSQKQLGTSLQTGSLPSLWAEPFWKRQSASSWQTGRRTLTLTFPAFSGFCWVGKCRPFWFEPLSFSHLLRPQAGRNRGTAFLHDDNDGVADTAILSGPTGLVRGRRATFTFSSPEPGVTFECSIDGEPFSPCTSPFTTRRLRGGTHTFQVRARDAAGNVDPTPATFQFRISK